LRNTVKISANITRVILGLILMLITIPLLMEIVDFRIYGRPVGGAYYNNHDTSFYWREWFKGSYQDCKNKYVTQNFKLHDFITRFYNQVDFTLFKKAHARDVIVGKENYLFEGGHIRAYYGQDFIGEERIENYISQLRCVQDTLAKHNKLLLVVIAPGKGSFYPEYIPFPKPSGDYKTNYTEFRKTIERHRLNFIDFNKYFASQKNKSKYPLYPQYGTHWSEYGATVAYDSIVKYIEHAMHADVPDLVVESVQVTDSLQKSDRDILNGINLYKEPSTFQMAYPKVTIKSDSSKSTNLNLLVVSDSFWWQAYNNCWPGSMFKSHSFWYYNELIYPESLSSPFLVKSSDYYKRLEKADVILIMNSEATLARFGRGFTALSHEVFCAPDPVKREMQEIKESIYGIPDWYRDVQRKAAEKGIEVDSMMTLDALYVYDVKHPKH
jgi:hypothetical protein